MSRRLASLLNSCESGHLLIEDQKELSYLITEYFTADNCHDDGWSDDDSDSEGDVPVETGKCYILK